MKRLIFAILLLTAWATCYSQNGGPQQFRLPSVPDTIRTVEGRFNYVVGNYWTNFNFSDTLFLEIPERACEMALVNYADLLSRLPLAKSAPYLEDFLAKASASAAMQNHMAGLLRKYLVNYDSPLRNHELYICAAEYLKENALDEITRYNAMQDAHLLSLNPQGSVAADFTYFLPDNTGVRMHGVESPYTLLFFYNPNCRSCQGIIEALKTSTAINRALETGALTLLAIYTQDDSPVWREFIKETPQGWTNGCDNGMKLISENIYDLRNLPVFYLLDSKKRILVKDLPLSQIEKHFK